MSGKKKLLAYIKLFIKKDKNKRSYRKTNRNERQKNLLSKKNKSTKTKKEISNFSSLIIFSGFAILSLAIFIFIRQINPLIKNERLKYLCTYQLGNKKNELYNKKILKLENLVGDSKKFCRDFIFPKDNRKTRRNFVPFLKDIFFRVFF